MQVNTSNNQSQIVEENKILDDTFRHAAMSHSRSNITNTIKQSVFVYKIIHDLRNPIKLQKHSYKKIIDDLVRVMSVFGHHINRETLKYRTPDKILRELN